MSDDAPIHKCESEIDYYVPYSLRRVCGFFNVPQIFYYMCKGLWDGAYGLSSLSEKTRKSNRLQMLLQRQHFLLSYLKTLSVGPAGVWTYGLPLSRPALTPIEKTGRRRLKSLIACRKISDRNNGRKKRGERRLASIEDGKRGCKAQEYMKGAQGLPSSLACQSRPTYPQGGSQCMRAPPSLSSISAQFPWVIFFLHAISTICCGDKQLSPSFDWQISWSEDQCQRSISLTTSSCQGNNNKHF